MIAPGAGAGAGTGAGAAAANAKKANKHNCNNYIIRLRTNILLVIT